MIAPDLFERLHLIGVTAVVERDHVDFDAVRQQLRREADVEHEDFATQVYVGAMIGLVLDWIDFELTEDGPNPFCV